MPTTKPATELRNFYDPADYTQAEVTAVQEELHAATEIERQWIKQAGALRYARDDQVEYGAYRKELHRVDLTGQFGILPIYNLRNHPTPNYSQPYLNPAANHLMQLIGQNWFEQEGTDSAGTWRLALTSAVRSTDYQARLLRNNPRKPAIDTSRGLHSSHEYGFAFDLDAGGLYLANDEGISAVNPRVEHDHDQKLLLGRDSLRRSLASLAQHQVINYVEELPDTQQWCFHVCANPTLSLGEVMELAVEPIAA